ncbi:MAG: hypothetical protein GWN62_02590 [Aliifodinibius sp.]|nr:hypothetical protein [Fodinibius sp.]
MAGILDMISERVLPNDPEAKNIAITHGDDAFNATAGSYGKEYADEKGFNVVFYESFDHLITSRSDTYTNKGESSPTNNIPECCSRRHLTS